MLGRIVTFQNFLQQQTTIRLLRFCGTTLLAAPARIEFDIYNLVEQIIGRCRVVLGNVGPKINQILLGLLGAFDLSQRSAACARPAACGPRS